MVSEAELPEYSLVTDAGEILPCSEGYSGKGKAAYTNGDAYDGDFVDGKRTGTGVYTWVNGAKFEGKFVDNLRDGYGKLTNPDGGFYAGHYKAGKKHGFGTQKYANADVYTGDWLDGKKHGKESESSGMECSMLFCGGVYEYGPSAQRLDGHWGVGNLLSGKWMWSDGTHWQGSFLRQQPFGHGTWKFPSGASESGEYSQVVQPTTDCDDIEGTLVKLTWSHTA